MSEQENLRRITLAIARELSKITAREIAKGEGRVDREETKKSLFLALSHLEPYLSAKQRKALSPGFARVAAAPEDLNKLRTFFAATVQKVLDEQEDFG